MYSYSRALCSTTRPRRGSNRERRTGTTLRQTAVVDYADEERERVPSIRSNFTPRHPSLVLSISKPNQILLSCSSALEYQHRDAPDYVARL